MKIKVSYYKTIEPALCAALKPKQFSEIIFAKNVASREDFINQVSNRNDMPVNFVDISICFDKEHDEEAYLNKSELMEDFMYTFLSYGHTLDQFIITAVGNSRTGTHIFHVLASLVDRGDYPVMWKKAADSLKNTCAYINEYYGFYESRNVFVLSDVELPVLENEYYAQTHCLCYDSYSYNDPLIKKYKEQMCHDLKVALLK